MKKLLILFLFLLPLLSFAAGEPMSIDDQVVRIVDRDYGHGVGLKKHSAIYKLKKSNPNFESLLLSLKESLETKSALTLKVDPFTMEIQELSKK